MLNLRELRSFQCVAELRSFTKASIHLRIAQPALSRQIRKLEEELNVQLFLRTGKGLELTGAGALLFERTYQVSQQISQIVDDVRSEAGRVSGTVTLGVPPATGELFVPPVIARCAEIYPGIRIDVIEGVNDFLYESLVNQQVSLCIMHDPQPRPDIDIRPLVVDQMHIIGPGTQMPGRVAPIQAGQGLDNLPMILPGRAHGRRLLIEQSCLDRGWKLNVVTEVNGFAVIRGLVAAGLGYSVLTYHSIYRDVDAGRLSSTPFRDPEMLMQLCMAYRNDKVASRSCAAVMEVVASVAQELVGKGVWHGGPQS